MTNPDYTAIAVLMDRSGSMQMIKDDAQGAVNSFVEDQKKVDGMCTVRLAQFDTTYEDVYKSTDVKYVDPYTLVPRGGTALTDGIGKLVYDFGKELDDLHEVDRPGKVIVVIVTDGGENASREYTTEAVKALITDQQEKYGWEFIFLAANQDAIAVGGGYGMKSGNSITFNVDNIAAVSAMAGEYVTNYRGTGNLASFTEEDRTAAVE